jgi:hypothetical protein
MPALMPVTVAVVPAPVMEMLLLDVLQVPPAVGSLTVVKLPTQTLPESTIGDTVANAEKETSNRTKVSRRFVI